MSSPDYKINWPLIGNKHISDFLSKTVSQGDASGVYIFSGPDNLGKTSTAVFFAQALLCDKKKGPMVPCGQCSSCKKFMISAGKTDEDEISQGELHGDLYFVKRDKEKKNISVEQIRDFIRSLSMSSFLNSYKIGIIKHAHSMSEGGFNAILKTLEEPRDKVVVILITSDIDLLPATIISRSKILRFGLVEANFIYDDLINRHKASRSAAKIFSKACLGRPALAVKFFEDEEFRETYFQRAKSFLEVSGHDVNRKIHAVDNLLGKEKQGLEMVSLAERILEIWQGVARDLLLIWSGNKDLIQHEFIRGDLEALQPKLNKETILNFLESLKVAKKHLKANVNPKLVLENVIINI